MAEEIPITENQLNFLKQLVRRIDITFLNQGSKEFVTALASITIDKMPKRHAKVAISFLLYLESCAINRCFCDSLGVVEFI